MVAKKNDGFIVGTYKNKMVSLPWNSSLPNNNVFVASGPGGGKSQGLVIPNVIAILNSSIVVTDPSGEVYAATAKIKETQGFKILVLNYENMYCSMRHNPLLYVETQRDAITISELIVSSRNDSKNKDIWYNTQVSLLTCLILYFKYEIPKEQFTIPGILDFLENTDMEQDEETGMSDLDEVFLDLPKGHPARRAYTMGFGKSKAKTRSSIAISIVTTLSNYLDEEVQYFMSGSDFILDEIAKEKCILYIITPPMDESWDSMINLTYNQLFQRLYKVAGLNKRRLPVPLFIIMDELPNIGKLEKLERFEATCRKYGIAIALIIQNITQLYDVYGKEKAESIIGNCATKICLGNCNTTTNEYFSKICGTATKRVETGGSSTSKGSNHNDSSSESQNYNFVQAPLITADEIDSLDGELIMKASNAKPIKLNKYMAWEMFPNDIMQKYETDPLEYEAYTTEFANQFLKENNDFKKIEPKRKEVS